MLRNIAGEKEHQFVCHIHEIYAKTNIYSSKKENKNNLTLVKIILSGYFFYRIKDIVNEIK